MKGYFASHFFNDAVFQWTENLASEIEEKTGLNLYVPQRNAAINDKKNNDATITAAAISKADTAQLKAANILIACLDGLTIDDGVAAEVMAHGVMAEMEADQGIHFPRLILGLITDMRAQGTGANRLYRNLMIIGKVEEHGKVIYGYPGERAYIDSLIQEIQHFMEENTCPL